MIDFDAKEIANWADNNTPDATHQFPRLLSRLILATAQDISSIEMASGSSVWRPGYDGLLEVTEGNPWVPSGKSAWEFGVGNDPQRKATDDYKERTNNTRGIDRKLAAFVFVTPRVWNGKEDWINARREEGNWTDVCAYDATDLVIWLSQAPGVADWFARLIRPWPERGFACLDDWWEHWASPTKPDIQPELVVAGRSQESDAVRNWLREPASSFYVQGDTREEAIAFLVASALTAPARTKALLFAKAVVVKTPDAWRSLERGNYPMVLIRDFVDDEASGVAVNKGHHVMLPLDNTQDLHGKGSELPRLGRNETLDALQSMGMTEHQARALSRKTARRLPIIRRRLRDEAGAPPPKWASPKPSRSLTALVFIGQWSEEKEGDKEIVAKIAGIPYEEVQQELTPLLNIADAPLTKIGQQWRYVSHEEAWHVLAPYLTSTDAERFEELAAEILGRKHPKFDLPIEERWYSSIKGKALPFSGTLAEGIARALALIGTQFERMENVQDAQYISVRVVHRVLTDGSDWRTWGTLNGLLPTLMEAAPGAFQDAIANALDAEPSAFAELFIQEGDSASMFTGTLHTGLLWGLERLAWSKFHFSRAAILLARLAELDPGGRVLNRPSASLVELFNPWINFTEATDDVRLEVLAMLLNRYPKASWSALVNAFPSMGHNGIVLLKDPPLWQPWGQDGHSTATNATLRQFVAEMIRLLLENVGVDVARWKDLVGILAAMPQQARRAALSLMVQQADSLCPHVEAEQLRAAIRTELNRHRSYPDADWAIPSEDLDILNTMYDRLTPDDPVAADAWLFDSHWPDLPDGDCEERRKQIGAARQEAVVAIYESGGVDAIKRLLDTVDYPHILGTAIAAHIDTDEVFPMALDCLKSDVPNRKNFSMHFLKEVCRKSGRAILDQALDTVKSMDEVKPEFVANIYVSVTSVDFKTCLQRLGAEAQAIQDAYWDNINWIWLEEPMKYEIEEQDRLVVIQNLLAARRSLSVTQLIWKMVVPLDLVILTLEQIPKDLANGNEARYQSLPYEIAHLFKKLDESEHLSDDVIATLERPYIGMLEHHRPNLALHREVLRQPSLFADLVAWRFKRTDGTRDYTVDEQTRSARVSISYHVLSNLRGLPGISQGGVIDVETLETWVSEARQLCGERGRENIGDRTVGNLLANAPTGEDGVWPCEPVRDLLDNLPSPEHIGRGFVVGKRNLRGVTSRGPYDGGAQERELAERYHNDAANIASRWPFTAKLLQQLARSYESDAHREDEEAEWTDATCG